MIDHPRLSIIRLYSGSLNRPLPQLKQDMSSCVLYVLTDVYEPRTWLLCGLLRRQRENTNLTVHLLQEHIRLTPSVPLRLDFQAPIAFEPAKAQGTLFSHLSLLRHLPDNWACMVSNTTYTSGTSAMEDRG